MPVYDKKSVKAVQDYLDALAKIPEAQRKAEDGTDSAKMKALWTKLNQDTKKIVSNIKQMAENTEEVDMMGEKLSKSFIEIRDSSRDLAEMWSKMPDLITKVANINSDWARSLNNVISTHEMILSAAGDHTKITDNQIKQAVQGAKVAKGHLDLAVANSALTREEYMQLTAINELNTRALVNLKKKKKVQKAINAANKIAGVDVSDMYKNFKDMLNPMSIGLAIVGAMAKTMATMLDDAIALNAELGTGLMDSLKKTDLSISGIFMSFIGVTAAINKAGAATALMAGSLKAGENRTLNINRAASALSFGVTVNELAQIEETLFITADMTREMAAQAVNATQAFAKANDVAPKAVLEDMASNAEMLAKYSDGTAEGMAKAAVYAQKLGINLSKVSQIADSLLDLETSMTAEFEASVLLNRDLNFDRARTLALNNDIQGAMEDIISQIGGEAEFARMNAVQRQALAGAIGVGADDLANMMKKGASAGLKDDKSPFENASLANETDLIGLAMATNGFLNKILMLVFAAVAYFVGKGLIKDLMGGMKMFKNRGGGKSARSKSKINKKATKSAKKYKKDLTKKNKASSRVKADKTKASTKQINDKLKQTKTSKPKLQPPKKPPVPKTPPVKPAGGISGAVTGVGKEGAEIAGKTAVKGAAVDQSIKVTEKQVTKQLAKTSSKNLLKFGAKKIPILGLLFAAGFAGSRAMKGDWTGAGLELLSGGASIIPGFGTGASIGIDATLMAMDLKKAGIIGGKAMGGPVTDSGTYMVGEMGPELVNLPKGANVYSNDQIAGAMRDGNASFADIGPLVEELRLMKIVMKDVATNTNATSVGINRINVKVEA
jgi:hypothetical protein